jgi:hypothetical protein
MLTPKLSLVPVFIARLTMGRTQNMGAANELSASQ